MFHADARALASIKWRHEAMRRLTVDNPHKEGNGVHCNFFLGHAAQSQLPPFAHAPNYIDEGEDEEEHFHDCIRGLKKDVNLFAEPAAANRRYDTQSCEVREAR